MEPNAVFDAFKVALICILWYICSASGNIIGKLVLNEFPYPMTVTMIQLLSASVYLGPILRVMNVPHTGSVPKRYYMTMIIPLAFGKFISSVSAHISMWKVSVSYAHTVKATLPLFTVILSRILLGEKQTYPVYFSLLPIIGGVLIATLTEVSFDIVGLGSALIATVGFSVQTIFSKKLQLFKNFFSKNSFLKLLSTCTYAECLKETGLHHLRLLVLLSRLATLCFLPMWFLFDFRKILHQERMVEENKMFAPVFLLLLDGFFNMLHNIFAFTVIAMVAPLSYAVCNATKRIVIIGASLVFLRNPVTTANIIGMIIAVFGVLLYNKMKGLTHSKSEANFHQNGFVYPENHILFGNNLNFNMEQVTLMPVSEHRWTEETSGNSVMMLLPNDEYEISIKENGE
ncbi:hypothetical protein KUTeg_015868, partial [Tegillarca granosa]